MKKVSLIIALFLFSCKKEKIEIIKTSTEPKTFISQEDVVEQEREKGFRFDLILSEESKGVMTILHGSEVKTINIENLVDTLIEEGMTYKYFSYKCDYSQASLKENNLISVHISLENEVSMQSVIYRNGSVGLSPMDYEGTIFERSYSSCSNCTDLGNVIIIPKSSTVTTQDLYLETE